VGKDDLQELNRSMLSGSSAGEAPVLIPPKQVQGQCVIAVGKVIKMTVRWGRCLNFKKCQDADHWEHIPVQESSPFICPVCGKGLLADNSDSSDVIPEKYRRIRDAIVNETPKGKGLIPVLVGAVAIVVVATAGYLGWSHLHSVSAANQTVAKNTILRLAGSNTIGDGLGPAMAAEFLKVQGATNVRIRAGANSLEKIVEGVLPGDSEISSITITAHGSATAFTALASDQCDIGMASRKIKPAEAATLTAQGDMSSLASEHILGLDGIAVIVNANNPVTQLDKDKIKKIFIGEITDWSQVGSGSGPIKIFARNDESGTYDTFKTLVLNGKPLASSAKRIEDSKELSDTVSADPAAIGFIGLPYVLSAKAVAVSEKGTQALMPNRLTVATEDYPLSRRLYLYTASNPQNKFARKFLEFALSRQGQDVVGNSGFIAQNVTAVAQTVAENAPDQYRELTKDAKRLSLDFRFQSGQTELDNKAKVDLDRVVSLIADLRGSGDKVMLFGFSDGVGGSAVNQTLSVTRAKAVASQFAQRGMDPEIVMGFGANAQVASNDTPDGQGRNRRVEIWIKHAN